MEQFEDWSHGLYKQYKAKTENAMRWITERGMSLGYDAKYRRSTQGDHSNGQDKQHLMKVPNVSSREIIGLAFHIAEHKSVVHVPRHIIWDIEDAITGRVHAAAWYHAILARKRETEEDQRHWHFIGVLETVLNALKPLMESRPQNASVSLEDRRKKPRDMPQNPFQLLRLESLDVDTQNVSTRPVTRQIPGESRHGAHGYCESDEKDDEEELYLFFYCLLQDLHEMRQAVRISWLRYRRRFSSLETAATVSHTAMLLAKSLEDDFWKNQSDELGRKEAMRGLFDRTREFDARGPATSDTMNELGSALSSMHEILTRAHHRYLSLRNRKWPKSEENSVPEAFLIPMVYQGPECDLLIKIFHTYRKYFRAQPKSRLFDAFSEGLRRIVFARTEQLIPIWLSFAARLVIDQLLIFRETSWPVDDSSSTFWRIEDSAKEFIGYNPSRLEENIDWVDEHFKTFYLQDEECEPTIRVMECNATFTGLHALYGLVDLQTLTFKINNQGEYLLPLAHLYHFLVSEHYLEECWPDMDMIIETHGINHMFVGGLPTESSQYVRKLELASGTSLRKFAKGQRKSNGYFNDKNRRYLNSTSLPISLMFAKNVRAWHSSPVPFPLHRLELLLRGLGDGQLPSMQGKVDLEGELQNQPELVQKLQNVRRLTPGNILSSLRKVLDREVPRLQIDYFELERQYRRLLFQMRQIFLAKHPEDRCAYDKSTELGELRHVVPRFLNSIPKDLYKGRTKRTDAEIDKAAASIMAVVEQVRNFCRKNGAEQTASILKLRPKFRSPIFPPHNIAVNQSGQEQETTVDISSELHPLRSAMLRAFLFDPQIVLLDEWIEEVEGPPMIPLDEWVLQQCLASFVLALYCTACFLILAIGTGHWKDAHCTPLRKRISHDAVTGHLSSPSTGPSASRRKKSVRRKR